MLRSGLKVKKRGQREVKLIGFDWVVFCCFFVASSIAFFVEWKWHLGRVFWLFLILFFSLFLLWKVEWCEKRS